MSETTNVPDPADGTGPTTERDDTSREASDATTVDAPDEGDDGGRSPEDRPGFNEGQGDDVASGGS